MPSPTDSGSKPTLILKRKNYGSQSRCGLGAFLDSEKGCDLYLIFAQARKYDDYRPGSLAKADDAMPATLIAVTGTHIKVEVTVELSRSLLETEEAVQTALNQAGCLLTQEALHSLDTDGSPVVIGGEVWRTKGPQPKAYQTPTGEVAVERHVYQRSGRGKTYCPLERKARMVITSTPRFAKQVSSKVAQGAARDVQRDLAENHARPVAVSYLQRLSEALGTVVQAKEIDWEDALPELDVPVASVAVGLDGPCLWLCENGWREAMVGTISLFNAEGERQHTFYVAATPSTANRPC